MKKSLILLAVLSLGLSSFAFDYVPKNPDANPFGDKNNGGKYSEGKAAEGKLFEPQTKTAEQAAKPEMREIKTLAEYFRYLPAEVHRHWTPYNAKVNYEVTVQFTVHRNGSISDVHIVGSNYPNANSSVLNAVKSAAPYQPLPLSFNKDSVKAQVVLEYRAK